MKSSNALRLDHMEHIAKRKAWKKHLSHGGKSQYDKLKNPGAVKDLWDTIAFRWGGASRSRNPMIGLKILPEKQKTAPKKQGLIKRFMKWIRRSK